MKTQLTTGLYSLLALSSALKAQVSEIPVEPEPIPCNTWYVDPVNGSNANNGTLFMPLATLREAMNRSGGSAGPDGIVLLPGEYNSANENWPLTVLDDVSIQGTDALNTVLIGTSGTSVLRFEAMAPGYYNNTVVDGVTIVGQNRCIEITDGVMPDEGFRVASSPTIANCFLIDSTIAAIDISVNVGMPWPADDFDSNGLVENRPKIINCTIVTSIIGILNRINGMDGWGESEPGLLNVLLSNNVFSDLEGIDSLDVITCAFATADQAGVSPIKAGRVLPVPVFNTQTNPPVYIDTGLGLALTPLDLRVRPISPAIDAGSLPALVWMNGTTGRRFFLCTMDIFDTDCEGYGNPRVARNAIDIGADESGELIIAGYERGTTDLNNSFNSTFNGQQAIFCNPFQPFVGPYSAIIAANWLQNIPGLGFWLPWEPPTIQHVRPILTIAPTPVPPLGDLLLALSGGPNEISFTLNFTAPNNPVLLNVPPAAQRLQFNYQALPFQGAVNRTFTNLQSNFWTP